MTAQKRYLSNFVRLIFQPLALFPSEPASSDSFNGRTFFDFEFFLNTFQFWETPSVSLISVSVTYLWCKLVYIRRLTFIESTHSRQNLQVWQEEGRVAQQDR